MSSSAPHPHPLDAIAPDDALDAPAARRNAGPLLAVLLRELPADGTVLEVGAGTGQHAAAFGPALSPRRWLPTDAFPERLASITAWSRSLPDTAPRPLPPRVLDASEPPGAWPITDQDSVRAVVSVNVVHIAPWPVAVGLFAEAARLLSRGDPIILYGPFARNGDHTGEGNRQFDADLRAQNPDWGIRDLDHDILPAARTAGFEEGAIHPMPANNLTVVLRRR